jgi:hypothetical protein
VEPDKSVIHPLHAPMQPQAEVTSAATRSDCPLLPQHVCLYQGAPTMAQLPSDVHHHAPIPAAATPAS